jgi:LacI family transcriptional regulator
MPWEKRITLRDVAQRVGLSIGAVSLAMRDHPSIPGRTAQRVKRAAAALKYQPDPALSALAAYRARLRVRQDFSVLALVSNWKTESEWVNRPSARELIAGAAARAHTLGYSLQHFWAREKDMTARRFSRVLHTRGIRGILLAPFELPTDRLDLEWDKFAAVTIELPVHYLHLHHVVPNHFAAMLMAWEQLAARGYTRIGFVVRRDLTQRSFHQWEAVYALIQSRVPEADRIPALLLDPDQPIEEMAQWLHRERPQAVISRSEGFFEAIRREGLRVPRDIGYVSLNVIDDQPNVSGVVQHRETMGAVAVDVLNSLLQSNHRGHHQVPQGTLVDGTWQEGKTLRAVARHRPRTGVDQPPG